MPIEASELGRDLPALLSRRLGWAGELQELQRLTGGATKQTWAFDWVHGERRERCILQLLDESTAPPAGARLPKLNAEHDAALMTAARAAGVPAPELLLLLAPQDGLGAGYVTRRIDGETLGRRIVRDESFAGARRVLAQQCGEALARIHQLPRQDFPFLQTLTPADELQLYADRLNGLERQHPALAYGLCWVRSHLPAQWRWSVVHADFRTGNLIVGPEGLRCVLDWEIARIGDPMQDLAVLCLRSWRFGGGEPVGGFGRREDLYAAYEAAGGERVDTERVRFWEVLNNLKWAISCVHRGSAKRADGRPARVELAAIGRRLEEPLWDLLNLTAA